MATALPDFPTFEVDTEPTSLGQRWKKYLARFENLIVALDITQPQRKKALLLHYAGAAVQEIFETLPNPPEPTETVEGAERSLYTQAVEKLSLHFNPQKNIEYETYSFRQAHQKTGETLDQFHTRLRQLADTCEFQDTNREIKSQIVQGCASSRLRRKALRDSSTTLTDLLAYGRALESSETQARGMENLSVGVNNVTLTRNTGKGRNPKQNLRQKPNNVCRNCGGQYPHNNGRESCPAYGQKCGYCHKLNHFSAHCRSKKATASTRDKTSTTNVESRRRQLCINQVDTAPDTDSSSDNGFIYSVHEHDEQRQPPPRTTRNHGRQWR